jgi:hypothetical protein
MSNMPRLPIFTFPSAVQILATAYMLAIPPALAAGHVEEGWSLFRRGDFGAADREFYEALLAEPTVAAEACAMIPVLYEREQLTPLQVKQRTDRHGISKASKISIEQDLMRRHGGLSKWSDELRALENSAELDRSLFLLEEFTKELKIAAKLLPEREYNSVLFHCAVARQYLNELDRCAPEQYKSRLKQFREELTKAEELVPDTTEPSRGKTIRPVQIAARRAEPDLQLMNVQIRHNADGSQTLTGAICNETAKFCKNLKMEFLVCFPGGKWKTFCSTLENIPPSNSKNFELVIYQGHDSSARLTYVPGSMVPVWE